MKLSRSVMVGLLVGGVVVLLSSASFADGEHKKGDHEAVIKTLRNSASALEVSHPDLAKGLTNYANEESKEIEGKEEKGAKEDLAEGSLVKVLNDSAAALAQSSPDLSKKLTEYADRKAKKIKAMTEKN